MSKLRKTLADAQPVAVPHDVQDATSKELRKAWQRRADVLAAWIAESYWQKANRR